MHEAFRLVRAFALCGELELMFRGRVLVQRSGHMCGPRTLCRRASPLAPIDASIGHARREWHVWHVWSGCDMCGRLGSNGHALRTGRNRRRAYL